MADLGIARPQDFLACAAGRLNQDETLSRVQHSERTNNEGRGRDHVVPRAPATHESNVDVQVLKKQIEDLNAKSKNHKLRFEIKDSSGQIIVEVIDGKTGEVLRTIPNSSVLNLQKHLGSETGLLVDSQS